MTTTETFRYRGYDIVPDRQWSKWCVSVYATRADLPLFSRSTLRTLAFRKEEAVAEAKQCIDRLLSHALTLVVRRPLWVISGPSIR